MATFVLGENQLDTTGIVLVDTDGNPYNASGDGGGGPTVANQILILDAIEASSSITARSSVDLANGANTALITSDNIGFASVAIACTATGDTMEFVIEGNLDGTSTWLNLSEGNLVYSLDDGDSELYRDNNCHPLKAVRVRVTSGTGTLSVVMNGGR